MTVRCAIYTRKSTEEGLEQSFNSLDAQRDAAEAYIASQKAEGWIVLPDRYDDGGFTGGNTDRPAFQQLMQDVREGKVDTIVVYKIDRLSRSLMDFAQIMETLEKHGVSLVSVTQQFNTTSSMGRLTLNILLSFAQFEREIISERTRDKIGAMRRKGKYWGGHPVLGYDVERSTGGSRMVINPEEAARVRHLFELYREHQAMMPVVAEAHRLGWTNKVWTTKAGTVRGGGPIDKAILWRMLTNVTYTGKVAHKGETYDGEHEAIIEPDLWQAVQAMLTRNSRSGGHGADGTRRDDALLRGLLVCQACGCAMMPTYTVKTNGEGAKKRYRYYTCHRANKRGKAKCPCPTLPAGEIEQFVISETVAVGRDPDIRDRVLVEAAERLAKDESPSLDHRAATAALAEFDHLWQALSPAEQRQLIQLLVERVAFDATHGRVSISFRPTGIATLGVPAPDEAAEPEPDLQEAAA
ncbi:MAG: recombinase family protein [Phycisphaeraceae bacterium]